MEEAEIMLIRARAKVMTCVQGHVYTLVHAHSCTHTSYTHSLHVHTHACAHTHMIILTHPSVILHPLTTCISQIHTYLHSLLHTLTPTYIHSQTQTPMLPPTLTLTYTTCSQTQCTFCLINLIDAYSQGEAARLIP